MNEKIINEYALIKYPERSVLLNRLQYLLNRGDMLSDIIEIDDLLTKINMIDSNLALLTKLIK